METSSETTSNPEPNSNPPERGRAWRIVVIVLTLHAALLGSVVLIQGCNQSEPMPMSDAFRTQPLAQDQAKPKDESPNQTTLTAMFPVGDVLTPEENLPATEPGQNNSFPAATPGGTLAFNTEISAPELYVAAPRMESAAQPQVSGIPATIKYSVRKGDTLSKIAKKHTVSARELAEANKISMDGSLKVGQNLVVPSTKDAEAAVKQENTAASSQPNPTTHIVKAGETPALIAKRYGVSASSLMEVNQITDPKKVRVNQKLVIPAHSMGNQPQASPREATPQPDMAGQPTGQASNESKPTHLVKAGETPASIARKYGVTVQSLMKVNNIVDPKKVRVNQKLVIPVQKMADTSPMTSDELNLQPVAVEEPVRLGTEIRKT